MGGLEGAVKAVGVAAGAWIAGKALGAVKDFVVGSVNAASNLEESINAVSVSFGENADEINKIGENAATQLGLSQAEFNAQAVSLSAFVEQIAAESGDVVGTLDDITGRATDFASVMNLEVGEALERFRSGLAGESEPLRKYGIDVSAAKIQQVALAAGIIETGETMTEAQKVQARYLAIMQQTEKVAGDFANTSEGFANQQRILNALWTDAQAQIGQKLLPVFQKVQRALINLIPLATRVIEHVGDMAAGFLGLADPILALVDIIPGLNSEVEEGFNAWDAFFTVAKNVAAPLAVIGEQFSGMVGIIRDGTPPTAEYTAELERMNEAIAGGEVTARGWLKEMENFPDTFTGTEAELASLVGTVEQYVIDAGRGRDRSDEYAAALSRTETAAAEADPAIAELEQAVEDYWADAATAAAKTDLVTEAVRGNISAMAALLDPVVNAAQKVEELNEKQAILAELQADSEASAADLAAAQLDVALALIETQGAFDALDPTTLEGSIDTIAAALQISKEEARLLLENLGLIDGMVVNATVKINEILRRSTFEGIESDPTRGRQHGGPVVGGTPYLVGEAGPEVFIPNLSGMIVPNNQINAGVSAVFHIALSGGATRQDAVMVGDEIERRLRRLADARVVA